MVNAIATPGGPIADSMPLSSLKLARRALLLFMFLSAEHAIGVPLNHEEMLPLDLWTEVLATGGYAIPSEATGIVFAECGGGAG